MIPAGTRVFFATEPVDLRRSFDGLAATALSRLGVDPREGGLFVFLNRRGTQVRVLFRDPQGWCILAKRLDGARFRRPRVEAGRISWETDTQTVLRFLDDVVPSATRSRAGCQRFEPSRRLELVQT